MLQFLYWWMTCNLLAVQKLAIKRMNLQATKEFMAELQVLTHVHHTNLVLFSPFLFVNIPMLLTGSFIDYH